MGLEYIITGRLAKQSTFLSQARILEYKTMQHKWIAERELINILSSNDNNVININSLTHGIYDVPLYQMVANQKRLIEDENNKSKLAIALVKKNQTVGLLVLKAPSKFEVIRIGSDISLLQNILNIDINDTSNILTERSISYKEQIPIIGIPQLRKLKWEFI